MQIIRLLIPCLCGFFLTGCTGNSGGPVTYQVSGEVTFEGQPVSEGQILLIPAQGAGQRQAGQIQNGQYSLESTTGMKRVEITAYRTDESKQEPDPAGSGKTVAARVQYIPDKFNKQSTLEIEVQTDGENHFTFELAP